MMPRIVLAILLLLLWDSCAYLFSFSQQRKTCLSSNLLPTDKEGQHEKGCYAVNAQQSNSFPSPTMSRSEFFSAAFIATLFVHADTSVAATNEPQRQSIKNGYTGTSMKTWSEPRPNMGFEEASTSVLASESSSLQESISGFVAGGALAATKTLVKYPLDTVTVRLQMPGSQYSFAEMSRLFSGSYSGVTLSLLSNIPGGAVFFAVKDAVKASLKTSDWTSGTPKWLTTTIAVGAALIPYWLVRNPSEVIKVRQQAGVPGYGEGVSAWDAVQSTLNETTANGGSLLDGIGTFYTGYWENVIYGLPADVIKFVVYEALTSGRRDLSAVEGAEAGAVATAISQLVTTPLDVIRNRLMTGTDVVHRNAANNGGTEQSVSKSNYIQSLIRLGREEGLPGLFAGATPRVAKAILSGAIQFATYEETKQSIARMLQQRR